MDAFGEGGRLKLAAWVAAGFFQFGQDVQNGRQAEAFVDEVGRFDLLNALAVADEFGGGNTLLRQHFGDDGIGFGVDGACVQRLFAAVNPQKACRLLEGFFAQTRHFQQSFAAVERAVFITVGDDVLGKGLIQTGNPRQERGRGGVHVHADGVHAVFDHRVQRFGELALVHVVLILPHADGFGVDFDQLGKRVLQPAGDRHCAAQGNVQVGELARRQFGCGINRRAGFGNDDFVQPHFRHSAHQFARDFVGFAAGGAVADGDELHAVLLNQARQRCQHIVFLMQIDDDRIQQLARIVHHGAFHAVLVTGVETQSRQPSGRCGKQQVFEIAGEHGNRVGVGGFFQTI